MSDYQPEINVLSIGGHYRPMFRLRPTDRWSLIRRDRKPVECASAPEARRIAQDLIDAIIMPAHLIEDETEPLGSVAEWRRQKDAETAAERDRVFAGCGPARVFVKGREVPVVSKRRRRAA